MTKVPERPLSKGELPKKNTMIVCTTDGKPLHPDDQKALEEFIEYRIKRNKRKSPPTKEVL